MTGLETAFYIVALVYMGISLIIIAGLLAAVVIIRKKIVDMEHTVKEKLDAITAIPLKVAEVVETVQQFRHPKKK